MHLEEADSRIEMESSCSKTIYQTIIPGTRGVCAFKFQEVESMNATHDISKKALHRARAKFPSVPTMKAVVLQIPDDFTDPPSNCRCSVFCELP
jgi:hypothetical protein